jgi:hypothetical protein
MLRDWLIRAPLSHGARRVALLILEQARDKLWYECCYRSQCWMAKELSMSRRAVRRALAELNGLPFFKAEIVTEDELSAKLLIRRNDYWHEGRGPNKRQVMWVYWGGVYDVLLGWHKQGHSGFTSAQTGDSLGRRGCVRNAHPPDSLGRREVRQNESTEALPRSPSPGKTLPTEEPSLNGSADHEDRLTEVMRELGLFDSPGPTTCSAPAVAST